MQVYLNSIDGIPDAIEAMYFSKRTWNEDLHNAIRDEYRLSADMYGFRNKAHDTTKLDNWLDMVCRMTKHHITVGKFIDLSFVVVGLHRAGQD